MTKTELIDNIKYKYAATLKKEADHERQVSGGWSNIPDRFLKKVVERVDSFLRNAYNRGFKDGRGFTDEELAEAINESYRSGYNEAAREAHYRIENGKTEGYNEGMKDAWETARKATTAYPTVDMGNIFGNVANGVKHLDMEKLFRFSPDEAMAKLSEYEALRSKPTNRDKFEEVFGVRLEIPNLYDGAWGGQIIKYHGVDVQKWLDEVYVPKDAPDNKEDDG